MPPLKVLFCTVSDDVWGAEESLLILLSHARSNGVDPTVAVGMNSPLASRLQALNIPVIEHQFPPHPAHTASGSLSDARKRDLLLELPALIKGVWRGRRLVRDYDVVVPFSLWQAAEIGIAARITRTPSVFDIHDTLAGRFGRLAVASISRICSEVVSPSRMLADVYGLSGVASIVPRPVAAAATAEPPSPDVFRNDGAITIGIFGQIAPHKRVRELVDELIRADSGRRARLLVVGGQALNARSSYENAVRELVERSRPDWEVIDRQPDVAHLMRKCDVVVNVSAHEAFGRTIIESIVNGSTPLVLQESGPAEIVSDTGVGRSFPDIESLVRYALETSDTIPDRDAIARVGRQYSAEHIARRYFDVIRGAHT